MVVQYVLLQRFCHSKLFSCCESLSFFLCIYWLFFFFLFFSPVSYISSCVFSFLETFGNMFMHYPFPPHVLLFESYTQSFSYILHFQCLLPGRHGPALRFRGLSSADSQKRCDEGHKIDGEQQSPCHKECFFFSFLFSAR